MWKYNETSRFHVFFNQIKDDLEMDYIFYWTTNTF